MRLLTQMTGGVAVPVHEDHTARPSEDGHAAKGGGDDTTLALPLSPYRVVEMSWLDDFTFPSSAKASPSDSKMSTSTRRLPVRTSSMNDDAIGRDGIVMPDSCRRLVFDVADATPFGTLSDTMHTGAKHSIFSGDRPATHPRSAATSFLQSAPGRPSHGAATEAFYSCRSPAEGGASPRLVVATSPTSLMPCRLFEGHRDDEAPSPVQPADWATRDAQVARSTGYVLLPASDADVTDDDDNGPANDHQGPEREATRRGAAVRLYSGEVPRLTANYSNVVRKRVGQHQRRSSQRRPGQPRPAQVDGGESESRSSDDEGADGRPSLSLSLWSQDDRTAGFLVESSDVAASVLDDRFQVESSDHRRRAFDINSVVGPAVTAPVVAKRGGRGRVAVARRNAGAQGMMPSAPPPTARAASFLSITVADAIHAALRDASDDFEARTQHTVGLMPTISDGKAAIRSGSDRRTTSLTDAPSRSSVSMARLVSLAFGLGDAVDTVDAAAQLDAVLAS